MTIIDDITTELQRRAKVLAAEYKSKPASNKSLGALYDKVERIQASEGYIRNCLEIYETILDEKGITDKNSLNKEIQPIFIGLIHEFIIG